MGSAELQVTWARKAGAEMMSAEQEGEPIGERDRFPIDEKPTTASKEARLAAVLEALLFVSPEPVPVSRLTTAVGNVSKAEVEQALTRLDTGSRAGQPRHSAGQAGRRLSPGDEAGVCAVVEAFGQGQGGAKAVTVRARIACDHCLQTAAWCAPRSKKFAASKRPACCERCSSGNSSASSDEKKCLGVRSCTAPPNFSSNISGFRTSPSCLRFVNSKSWAKPSKRCFPWSGRRLLSSLSRLLPRNRNWNRGNHSR